VTAKDDSGKLLKLIEKNSKQACLAFFANLSADERRTFAKLVGEKFKELEKAWLDDRGKKKRWPSKNSLANQLENARVCMFATATPSELLKLGWRVLPADGFIVDVIREIDPAWTNEWADQQIEREPRTFIDIRHLYEAGLCDKPGSDGYILGLIESLPGWGRGRGEIWDENMSLADRIRSTADIRDEDVWRLFEIEGGGDVSLSAYDKYIGRKIGGWAEALAQLGDDGTLD